MKTIVIISAMLEEMKQLDSLLALEEVKEVEHDKFDFIEGKYQKTLVVMAVSGVGRVNASLLISTIYHFYGRYVKIINIGTAGGLNQEIGSIVIGQRYLYGDVDITGAGKYRFGQMSHCPVSFLADDSLNECSLNLPVKMPIIRGDICTKEAFTTSLKESEELIEKHFSDFNIVAFDMESASYAQACYFYDLPFIAIRYLSDNIGMVNQSATFEERLQKSVMELARLVKAMLEKINR